MPKCERAGYEEPPFFYLDESGDTPFAVAWLPMKLAAAVPKLLRRWPNQLQVHFEVLDDDFDEVEFEAFGDIARERLITVLNQHRETAFADGGVRFRTWSRKEDREKCLGLDEHGVLYLWEEPARLREWFGALGVAERKAPLVYEGDHDHHLPEDADLKRNRFLQALALEKV